MGFSEYLRLYKESWLKLQMTSPQLSSYEDRSLYTTWQLSLDRIERQNALSAKLLKLWAYFDRQDVWFELLQHGSSACHDWIQKLTEDKLSFNEAVRLLCNYGIVDPDLSFHKQCRSRGYSMHSCVHSWTVSVLNKEWDESLAKLALTCIASEIPSNDEKDWWLLQRRLLRHALRHEQFITDSKVKTEGMEWTLCCLGDLYRNQGKLAEAEAMVIRALQGYEETLGPKHTSTLDTVNNLGVLYKDQGKLAEAEAIYTRALQGSEEALRPKHTSTLNTINNLGVFYRNQDKLTEAEAMYTRALQGREKALGPKHTSTLDIVNNLGLLYADQGKLAEAEAMYTRALQGSEKALGPKHTSTLATVNNLGVLYKNQGKLAEAEAMYTRALQGYEEALGLKLVSSYIPALNTMVNLGNLYSKTSEKDMARTVYTRALSGFATVQGPLSDRCRELERRLEVLDLTGDSESLVRKFLRKIRR
jgi:tetratricopeptide (TPR) repeat protein